MYFLKREFQPNQMQSFSRSCCISPNKLSDGWSLLLLLSELKHHSAILEQHYPEIILSMAIFIFIDSMIDVFVDTYMEQVTRSRRKKRILVLFLQFYK